MESKIITILLLVGSLLGIFAFVTNSEKESMTILNVQSYPTVGDNWTVGFKTEGAANLSIMFSNGTTADDLEILELGRGNKSLNFLYIIEKCENG